MLVGDELVDPVRYAGHWAVVATVLPVLVVAYYVAVTWWTREPTATRRPVWWRLRLARRRHLRELDHIATERAAGRLSTRQAHQAVSATVRSFAESVGAVDARSMNLTQLQEAGPAPVAAVVATAYPPAFRPGTRVEDDERLEALITEARAVVTGWSG